MSSQKVKISEIEKLLIKAAKKFVSKEEAEYFSKQQIECTLQMYPDVNPIEDALNDLETWEKLKGTEIEIQAEKPGFFLVNFHELGPSLKLKYLHDEVEKRAKENGIAMFGLNNSAVTDWLKLITYGLAKRGLIAIYMFNGGPGTVVPYGGSVPIFGTNPMSYAIPTEDDPILLDMATSESAFYKYSRARKNKVTMRKNCLVDENGNPTTDPEKAAMSDGNARILPMGGGYKGYGIVLLIEILTGALIRSKMGASEKSSDYIRKEYGGMLIAIDIASLGDLKICI